MSGTDNPVVTIEESLEYMGIDYADDVVKRNVWRLIKVADLFLQDAVGKNYPRDDARAKEIALIVIDDGYSNRGMNNSTKVSNATRKLVDNLLMQLKLGMVGDENE